MVNDFRVLMIEDEPVDAELMELTLKRAGYHFSAKRVQAETALAEALLEFAPNLVLSDYNLPGYDGLSALRKVREVLPEVLSFLYQGPSARNEPLNP